MIEGMRAGNPDAVALLYDWAWDRTDEGKAGVLERLPKRNVRILSVSERGMPVNRGGKDVVVSDYAISVVGPGEAARQTWRMARANGIPTTAKVPLNLVREGVDGVCGGLPSFSVLLCRRLPWTAGDGTGQSALPGADRLQGDDGRHSL